MMIADGGAAGRPRVVTLGDIPEALWARGPATEKIKVLATYCGIGLQQQAGSQSRHMGRKAMRAFVVTAFVSLLACGTAVAAPAGKTAKECRAEWQVNKADNQAKGITEKAYVAQCRAAATTAAPTAAPATAPATTEAPPATPPAPTRRAAVPPATAPTGEGQYASEAEAKGHCPSDTVVWVNLTSRVYHFAGTKNYGNTKHGAYMCEKGAMAAGDRASKAEKHP
jgi:hypothetical protein